MKKIIFFSALLFSISVISSELDEAYLLSLPQDIRADVIESIEERDNQDKPIYRRESSMIKKPATKKVSMNRFGDNIFNMMQSSFMPINEPNFDGTYIVDFGDTIELQLIGQKNSTQTLSVNRDGSINVPEIGKIFVSGLDLNAVADLIKSKVNSAFIGIEAFISLNSVRDIQVLIVGNAYNPGMYTLNGNSSLLHALSMAGGVDQYGSYRNIHLIRGNQVIYIADLYDVFIDGKSNLNTRLRSGDVILVKPYEKLLKISGAVKRPALYELNRDEGFIDLITFANGFKDSADKTNMRIQRLAGDEIQYIDVDELEKLKLLKAYSSDTLYVKEYERRTVKVSGAVNMPGTYFISSDETVSSIIKKADGYTENAYPFAAILNNKNALALNIEAADKLYRSFIQTLITEGSASYASDSLPLVLEELKKSNINGRLIAEFDLDVIKANPELDTLLQDGDEIIVPQKTQQVFVFGEVNNSGAVRHESLASVNAYLEKAGGYLDSADLDNIYIIHPNGQIDNTNNFSRLSFLDQKTNINLIYPGSVIYVPRKLEVSSTNIASIWAPIISSMATSIAALAVLGNQ